MSSRLIFAVPCAMVIAVLAILALVVRADMKNSQDWEAFKAANNCRITSQIDGEILPSVGIGSNGQTVYSVTTTPSKTAWTCNDGITYYK